MKNKKFVGPVYKESEAFILADFYKKNNQSILYIGKDNIEINSTENKLKWLFPNDLIPSHNQWKVLLILPPIALALPIDRQNIP